MKTNFTFRLFKDTTTSVVLSSIDRLIISNIVIVSKPSKFGELCLHKKNQNIHGYTVEFSKPFNKVSGSHSSPSLTFKGEYIDIIIKNFPRYPCFSQDIYAAKGCLNGYGYINYSNKGFPLWTAYRNYEFINNLKL